jgi:hypothetical protein
VRVAGVVVLHEMPGRLRLRLPPHVEGARLEAALVKEPGVEACAWRPLTRSLLVRYRPGATTSAALRGVAAVHAGPEATGTAPPRGPRLRARSPLARAIREAFTELDAGVARASRGTIDLGLLLPLGLAAWGAREIVRGQAGPLAWSAALWYAHGLFRHYGMADETE